MEYELFINTETAQKWDETLREAIWFMNNPKLEQPAQKWHRGDGFYLVVNKFGDANVNDVLLIKSYVHTRIIKIATAKNKQVFFNWREGFSAYTKFTPEQWLNIRPLTKKEIYRLLPHMSIRIKQMCGYFEYMKFFPEHICTECIEKLGLEIRKGWSKGGYKRCNNCGKSVSVTATRNSLKPIGR